MFRRIVFEDSAAIYTIVAFITAGVIFCSITWRALRMPRQQVDRFANLPFTTDTAEARHDHSV